MARHSDEKSKLIQILEETPLVNYACKKIGIGRTTFYRWMKSNLQFKRDVERAMQNGRFQWNEIAESALMKNVRDGKMDAVKFYLAHNDKRYIPKRAVFIKEETSPEERARYEWAMRNKPLSDKQTEGIMRAFRNYGIIKDIEDNKKDKS